MGWFQDILDLNFWGNTGQQYLIALAIFVGLFVIFIIFEKYVLAYLGKKAKKTKYKWDDIILGFVDAINWQFYFYVSLYIGSLYINLSDVVRIVLKALLVIFIGYYAAQGLSRIVNYFTEKQIDKIQKNQSAQNKSMVKSFGLILKISLYVLIGMMILSNLGIEITPLIAGLGVGGIAIAIALQSVLGDLFSAFVIYLDKPFVEGDFIIVGSDMGTVEKIGIKTTRIKTLQGQELVMSNSELTNSRVNNYKKMQERRIQFNLGVEYATPSAKLKKIDSLIAKAVTSTKNTRLDRVHFFEFGNFSLNFQVVYYVLSPDYNLYMDIQQEINFKIREAFEKEGIVFAFPTQTVFMGDDGKDKKK